MCNTVGLDEDTDSKTTPLRFYLRDASNDISYDLFGSGHDLELRRSIFKFDLSRSNYISFDASRRDKHDDVRIIYLPYF